MEEKNLNIDELTVGYNKRYNPDEAYERFLARTGKNRKTTGRRKFRYRLIWQGAAAVALLLIVSYVSFKQGNKQVERRFADIVVEAPWGSRTKTLLPDGTMVWLNAGSKITYSQGFGVNERNIRLNGEGYFEVIRNEKLPFDVHTGEMSVHVLGTQFNFKNYDDDDEAVVSLLEGKVLVNNNINRNENATIDPNQRVSLNKRNGKMTVSGINARNTSEWTEGFLFFDEELLTDIAKKLERSYDVKISFSHPDLEHLRFYGNFNRKEQTLNEVLDMLASTGKIKYRIQGKKILLCD